MSNMVQISWISLPGVSVQSSRESFERQLAVERDELEEIPEEEEAELALIYQAKGLSEATARTVARELTDHDALGAHLEAELKIDEAEVVNAWHAAFASAIAFTIGAVLPLLTILLLPAEVRIPLTFVAVVVALAITGTVSARIGGSSKRKATLRLVIGGALAMAFTYAVGLLLGTTGIA